MAESPRGGGSTTGAVEEGAAQILALFITAALLRLVSWLGLDIDVLSVEGAVTAGGVLTLWKALQWKWTTRTPV